MLDDYLKRLSDTQLSRLYRQVWDRMTRHDGYQPFGYDLPTLRLTNPGFLDIILSIRGEAQRRLRERVVTV